MEGSKLRCIVVLVLCIILLTNCVSSSKKTYTSAAREFNELYFKVVECIDLSDIKGSLEKLHSDENIKNIENLDELLISIRENIPKDKKKLIKNFEGRYEDLKYLNDSYKVFEQRTTEERRKVFVIFNSIVYDKSEWKDKSSNIVWE